MEFNSLFQNSEMKCTWPEQMSVMIWSCVNNIYQIILSFVYGMSSSICNIEVFCCIHTSTHVYTSILQPHLFSILLFFFCITFVRIRWAYFTVEKIQLRSQTLTFVVCIWRRLQNKAKIKSIQTVRYSLAIDFKTFNFNFLFSSCESVRLYNFQ